MATEFPPVKISWVRDVMTGAQYVPSTAPGEPGLYYHRYLPAGAAHLSESLGGQPYLQYVCPCGCGVVGALPLAPLPKQTGWAWEMADDMRVAPVLRPSIARKFGCRWHGYLGGTPTARAPGMWVTCGGWVKGIG